MWEPNNRIIVGVSGGPDSVCLLHILASLASQKKFLLHAVHVNYQLRDKDSRADEVFVRDLCQKWNIPLTVYTAKKHTKPSEKALRDLRYTQFEVVRKKHHAHLIAVGHHKDDQAETLLLHLFRGCGTKGMVGMRPKNGRLIRPLLALTRQEILTYLVKNNLSYRTDASNNSLRYTRNKVRHHILPEIKRFYPQVIATLARGAEIFGEEAEILDSLDQTLVSQHLTRNKDTIIIRENALNSLAPHLQKRLFKKAVELLQNTSENIENSHILEIIKATQSKKSKIQTLSFLGLIYEKKSGTVTLRKK